MRRPTCHLHFSLATKRRTIHETYREKMDAERLARKHHGIDGVRDFIAVQPVVPVSDQELRETIANRLRYDRIGYGITFNNFEVSVRDGVVTIAGEARSYPDNKAFRPRHCRGHSWRA